MKRKVNYNARMYKTSVPKEIIEILNIKDGDFLEYTVNKDGTVTITKAEKGE